MKSESEYIPTNGAYVVDAKMDTQEYIIAFDCEPDLRVGIPMATVEHLVGLVRIAHAEAAGLDALKQAQFLITSSRTYSDNDDTIVTLLQTVADPSLPASLDLPVALTWKCALDLSVQLAESVAYMTGPGPRKS